MNPTQVILVEDDRDVSALLTYHLKRAGHEVRTAESVSAGRELTASPWDIVLLDRNLPDGDGLELCHELRVAHPHGYIIMLTGDARDEAKLEGFARESVKRIIISTVVPRALHNLDVLAQKYFKLTPLSAAVTCANCRLAKP